MLEATRPRPEVSSEAFCTDVYMSNVNMGVSKNQGPEIMCI